MSERKPVIIFTLILVTLISLSLSCSSQPAQAPAVPAPGSEQPIKNSPALPPLPTNETENKTTSQPVSGKTPTSASAPGAGKLVPQVVSRWHKNTLLLKPGRQRRNLCYE
ncbi:MAG: hypothetical protein NT082_05720 [Chloroflexi bacterium]|nr:hypothetical protein [Chloroflexota bacterium]